MNLNYEIDKLYSEKFIALFALGILHSLQNKTISIDEAEGFIFTPSTSSILYSAGYANELIEIINEGVSLDDYSDLVPELLPEKLRELISRTERFIHEAPDFGREVEKNVVVDC